jgi:hypothetical protein
MRGDRNKEQAAAFAAIEAFTSRNPYLSTIRTQDSVRELRKRG